jgi:hypothetical protein
MYVDKSEAGSHQIKELVLQTLFALAYEVQWYHEHCLAVLDEDGSGITDRRFKQSL